MSRILIALLAILAIALSGPMQADTASADEPVVEEWEVEWGGRTRDPSVAPNGKVWFVGQAGNYVATFDPAKGEFRRYEIEDGTNPHTVIVDDDGFAWYAGNRNGRIGRIDPESGELTVFMTGEARDPHTMVFDGKGHIWFTSQHSNRVGRLNMETGALNLVQPYETPSRPYGIVLDSAGDVWVSLFNTDSVVRIDARTLGLRHFREATPQSRSRRLETTSDGSVWYVDEPRGYLGRIDRDTGEVREYRMPGGDDARPYAITKDARERLWISQTGPEKRLVGFDPRSERFVSVNEVSHNIRHMDFHEPSGAMWFGTDANRIGRLLTDAAAR
jgi:virginiamycin B lyase